MSDIGLSIDSRQRSYKFSTILKSIPARENAFPLIILIASHICHGCVRTYYLDSCIYKALLNIAGQMPVEIRRLRQGRMSMQETKTILTLKAIAGGGDVCRFHKYPNTLRLRTLEKKIQIL